MIYSNYRIPAWVIPVLLIAFACDTGVKINDLNTGLDEQNALRYNIQFKTDIPTNARIEYWPTDDIARLISSGTSSETQEHEFKLIGMYPNTDYTFHIVIKEPKNGAMVTSDHYHFKTDSLPDALPKFKVVVNMGEVFNGFILVRKVIAPGSAILLDNNGNIIWYDLRDTMLMKPFDWTPNNTIISLDNATTIDEINLFGDQVLKLKEGEKGLSSIMHHEISRVENNDILALTHKFTRFDLSGLGGSSIDSIKADGILRLDSVGNQVWSWDMLDFVDPLLMDKNILKSKQDWSHANSLNITHDGNYIISFRSFDQVWKIDSSTGEVIWKLGRNGDFELKEDHMFYQQHAVHELDENEYLIFDNGDLNRKTSRALKLKLDEKEMKILEAKSVFLPDSLFSFKQGSVYELKDENYMFCVAAKNKIVITDNLGNILWQVNSTEPHYRAYFVSELPMQTW